MKIGDIFIRNNLDRKENTPNYIIVIEDIRNNNVYVRKLVMSTHYNVAIHRSQIWNAEEIERLFYVISNKNL